MNITDLFARLSYAELSNLKIGNDGNGTIDAVYHPRLVNYINDGLLALYSKFLLRENDLVIQQHAHITEYFLTKDKATSSPSSGPTDIKYIIDFPASPFEGDLIKILKVTDVEGRHLPLNDLESLRSFFTPQPHVLQITYPIQDVINGVTYQARHPLLTADELETEINLPAVLEVALQSYVAHKVFFHMGGQDNAAFSKAHLDTYNQICKDVVDRDLVNSSSSYTSHKFHKRGFV